MQTALHAIGWGASRLVIALVLAAFAALLIYAIWVFVIVAIQAAGALAQ